jgi:hypothetical protein
MILPPEEEIAAAQPRPAPFAAPANRDAPFAKPSGGSPQKPAESEPPKPKVYAADICKQMDIPSIEAFREALGSIK